VDWLVDANVSKKRAVSIFRAEVTSKVKPIKNLSKVGVKRRRETASVARLQHSCVRNALLEMVNVADEAGLKGTIYIKWKQGKSEKKIRAEASEAENEPDQWGDSKQAPERGG
jgi:hypothetical protein